MSTILAPYLIYQSPRRLDDSRANDMRCGDLDVFQLRDRMQLRDISSEFDPYTMTKTDTGPANHPAMAGHKYTPATYAIGAKTGSRMLFDEMRQLGAQFSWAGGYKDVLSKLITHLQTGDGKPYRDRALDYAFRDKILGHDAVNPMLAAVRKTIAANIDWQESRLRAGVDLQSKFRESLNSGLLPAYSRWHDLQRNTPVVLNDTWASEISLESLTIKGGHFKALLNYTLQGHFGLSADEVTRLGKNSRFFRIWFILQHYNQFAYKPFVINIKTAVEIAGKRAG